MKVSTDLNLMQHAFNIFYAFKMLHDLFQPTEQLVQQSVECMLKQILKAFKRTSNVNNKVLKFCFQYLILTQKMKIVFRSTRLQQKDNF